MTTICILGSGRVAAALAAKLAPSGHDVVIGTRNVAETGAKWAGPPVRFAQLGEGSAAADVVINATPGDSSLERLGALKNALIGKVLIDVSNATTRGADGLPSGLSYPNDSLAERLQAALPDTKVVKTLNTMLFTVMINPQSLKSPPTAFLSGNDADAKARVAGLLVELGWPAEWIEDIGDITSARGVEAFMLLVPAIMKTRGFAPFALTVAH